MKSILNTALTIFALTCVTTLNAQTSTADGDTLYCRITYQAEPAYITTDLGEVLNITLGDSTYQMNQNIDRNFLITKIANWLNYFKGANDPLFTSSNQPLCVGLIDDSQAANAYASNGTHVVFGVRLLTEAKIEFQSEFTYAVSFVSAHEFAHIIQQRYQLVFDYVLPMLSSKQRELHADCMAGYLLEAHKEIPFINYETTKRFVESLGSAHIVSSHGMSDDRVNAMKAGMDAFVRSSIYEGVTANTMNTFHLLRACSPLYPPTYLQAN